MTTPTLHSVLVTALVYPCWTYAIKRSAGEQFSLEHMPKLRELFQDYDSDKLEVGDIVIWTAKPEEATEDWFPIAIEASGRVISKKVLYDCHCAVYEGDGQISDASIAEGCRNLPFMIRLCLLSDMKPPHKMISRKRMIDEYLF